MDELLDTCRYPIPTSMLSCMEGTSRSAAIPPTPVRVPRPPKDEVRARVLHAAGEVFAERGFAAASLDQVAAAAGFTKGAVYSNFGSKDELFLALMEAEGVRRVEVVEAALRTTGDLASALAAVGTELSRRDSTWQLLF